MKYYVAFLLTAITICQCGSFAFELYKTAYKVEAKALMSELLDQKLHDLEFENSLRK